MIEKKIIQDQKETIHRLQEECKEKTDIIMALEQKAFIKNPVEAYEKLLKENAELQERLKTLDDEEFAYEVSEIEYNNFKKMNNYKQALEEIKNNCVEMLITIAEEGKPNGAIVDTIWCKNIPCCTLFELIENTQSKINEVLGAEDE